MSSGEENILNEICSITKSDAGFYPEAFRTGENDYPLLWRIASK